MKNYSIQHITFSQENSNLNLGYNDQILRCETHFKTPNGEHIDCELQSILKENDAIILKWLAPNIAEITQTFFSASQIADKNLPKADDFLAFDITVVPLAETTGMFVQTYGFSPEETPYFMIPGNLYGTNNIKNSKSIQPQLNYRGDISYPKTPVLFTRADRSTHNAVISVFNQTALGVRINESSVCHNPLGSDQLSYNGLGVDTRGFDPLDRIAITIGYEHFPVHYYGKVWGEPLTKENLFRGLQLKPNEPISCQGHLYLGQSEQRFGYENIVKAFYQAIHQPPTYPFARQDVIKDLALALVNDAYYKEHHYFPTTLNPDLKMEGLQGDLGWTGGFQVIYPLAKAVKHVKEHPEVQETVLSFIDHVISEGIHPPTQFFYESKLEEEWKLSGWWKLDLDLYDRELKPLKEAHSAYINGQACCYLLKVYQIAKEEQWAPENVESWLTACTNIIDKVIQQQRYDGALGVYYDPRTGDAVYYNSFQGAWFLAAMAELYKVTQQEKYLTAFEKANDFYFKFIEKVELWGTPIDTRDAVDEEGNLAYITALTTIHEQTQNPQILEQLIHAAHYEFSWKFAYNTRFTTEPLKSLKWQSCGGSITSSHNIHIHQMGNLIGKELHYLYQVTQDEYFFNRLKDTLNWGLGTHNPSPEYFGFGRQGWATEQFFHTDGKQDEPSRTPDGGIWESYLSWAAACVLLSTSEDIEDHFYYR